jgi:hypothetical protein
MHTNIRSMLLYCYPVFCNAPKYLKLRLLRIERRFARIIHAEPHESFLAAADAMCLRLYSVVENNPRHPLRRLRLFCEREKTPRNRLSLRPPLARTKRYSESFIKFARPT